jgi:hypothetical protein
MRAELGQPGRIGNIFSELANDLEVERGQGRFGKLDGFVPVRPAASVKLGMPSWTV